jgi:hypothetical protein
MDKSTDATDITASSVESNFSASAVLCYIKGSASGAELHQNIKETNQKFNRNI